MNYGLYLSASGMMTNLHRQDVHANNLANVSTAGFKRSFAEIQQRDAEVLEDRLDPTVSMDLLNNLGGGVMVQPSRLDDTPGPLRETSNDFDLAIDGDGYFHVRVTDAEGIHQRLTRDGRFSRDDNGQIVTTVGRHTLLDATGQPIIVDPTMRANIDTAGQVRQGDSIVAQIQLLAPNDPQKLRLLGHGLYALPDDDIASHATIADADLMQGWLEDSNVDSIKELLQLIAATKSVMGNGNLIQYHDLLMDRAVNVLGRVA